VRWSNRAGRWRWAGALVVAGLVAVAVWWLWARRGGVDWGLLWRTLRTFKGGWITASCILALLTYMGRALRWQILLKPVRSRSSLWGLFTATAIGFSAIVLFGRPGEMVRPYLIAMKEDVSFSSQVGAWFLERVYDLLMALLIFGLALSQVHASGAMVGEPIRWILEIGGTVVVVAAGVCLMFLMAARLFSATMRQRMLGIVSIVPERYKSRISRTVGAFTDGMGSTRSSKYVIIVLLYSVLEWALIILCYYCIFQASPETNRFKLIDVLIFVGFVSFGAVVQIPGIGGGLQVVSIVVLTELFGLALEVSAGVAMVIWAITFVVIVPFGLVLAFREGLDWRRLKSLAREVPS